MPMRFRGRISLKLSAPYLSLARPSHLRAISEDKVIVWRGRYKVDGSEFQIIRGLAAQERET